MNESYTVQPERIADTESYDGAAHNVVQLRNGNLLLVYTQNNERHFSTDGRIASRQSTDRGKSWSKPRTVHDEPGRDATAPSVVYHPKTGQVDLFGVTFEVDWEDGTPERSAFETHRLSSTDGGRTWSEPVPISGQLLCDTGIPFGSAVRTVNGMMTSIFSREYEVEVLFSDNGGDSWNNNGIVASSPAGRELAEPVPCAVTRKKLIIFGRGNASGDFYAITSGDGGMTWGEPVFFNPTDSTAPKPIWVKRTGPSELTAVWGDRDERCIYATSIPAKRTWKDPTILEDAIRPRLHDQIGDPDTSSYWGGDAGDFGDPTFLQLARGESEMLLTFYDEAPQPNLWQMYLS